MFLLIYLIYRTLDKNATHYQNVRGGYPPRPMQDFWVYKRITYFLEKSVAKKNTK